MMFTFISSHINLEVMYDKKLFKTIILSHAIKCLLSYVIGMYRIIDTCNLLMNVPGEPFRFYRIRFGAVSSFPVSI